MKRLFTFLTLISACSVFSQTYKLEGTVFENDEPLPGVHVTLEEVSQQTTTDIDGHYFFELPPGKYHLKFSHLHDKKAEITLDKDRQLDMDMTDSFTILEEVLISPLWVDSDSPITHGNMNKEELEEKNLGQDIPTLMDNLTSVVTTSDAGAGVGYSGIRVRGSDANRVNVTINGAPLNDAESQGTFWVNLGGFASSVESLQLQRGAGTSTNGAGAFGASLNVLTEDIKEKSSVELSNTFGSFNTHKHDFKFNTGLINDYFTFSGNISLSRSDGYRDRSSSDLKSYFLQGSYRKKNTLLKALSFGGSQQTDQAYYGITSEELKTDRRHNPAGMYTDNSGKTHYYDNQTDNYKQDHVQLLWNQKYDSNWSSNIMLYYTYGRGFYESYHQDTDLFAYGLPYFKTSGKEQQTSDLVNEKWLNNDLYGGNLDVIYKRENFKIDIGGGLNHYSGLHYGKVIYAEFAQIPTPFDHYYDNKSNKTDGNAFAKTTFDLTNDLSIYGDLQARYIQYEIHGPYEDEQDFNLDDKFTFINPKAGLTYRFDTRNQMYFSYGKAHKEPNRSDYKSAILGNESTPEYPKAESLDDYELGWRLNSPKLQINANIYYMDYTNQLVLTGEIDPEGRTIRKNSGASYRLGLEIDGNLKLSPRFDLQPHITISRNQNKDFITEIDGKPQNLGTTEISFSPNLIAGNTLRFQPTENVTVNFVTKFVGRQYLSNTEASAARLPSYITNGLNAQYTWKNTPLFKEIVFKGLVNNIFNRKYVADGSYSEGSGAFYIPQAGINFLTGITFKIY